MDPNGPGGKVNRLKPNRINYADLKGNGDPQDWAIISLSPNRRGSLLGKAIPEGRGERRREVKAKGGGDRVQHQGIHIWEGAAMEGN